MLAFLATNAFLRDASAELDQRDCQIIAISTTAGVSVSSIMPLSALSREPTVGGVALRSAALGVGSGALALGLCAAQVANPRSLPALMTGLGMGVGTFLLGSTLAGSREEKDAFRPNAWVWASSGALLAAGGAAGYFLADTPARQRWLGLAPLSGAVLGLVVFAGSHLRFLPKCGGGNDCGDRRDLDYRVKRDGLIGLGLSTLLGTAVGLIGAVVTPGVSGNGQPLAVTSGTF